MFLRTKLVVYDFFKNCFMEFVIAKAESNPLLGQGYHTRTPACILTHSHARTYAHYPHPNPTPNWTPPHPTPNSTLPHPTPNSTPPRPTPNSTPTQPHPAPPPTQPRPCPTPNSTPPHPQLRLNVYWAKYPSKFPSSLYLMLIATLSWDNA